MRAPASSRAAHSATTSLILRLREGSKDADYRTHLAIRAWLRGMPLPRPRAQEQEQRGAAARRAHLAPLVGREVRHEPGAARLALAAVVDLDLAVGDDQVRALVGLVLLQLLAVGQVDHDQARLPV